MVAELSSCYMADATGNCCRLGARSVYTIQPRTSLQCHYSKPHAQGVCVWQNYRDVLRYKGTTNAVNLGHTLGRIAAFSSTADGNTRSTWSLV